MSLQCWLLNWHDWSDWVEVTPCLEERSCRRCNVSEQQTSHRWEERYKAPQSSCKREQYCIQCEKVEDIGDVIHLWGAWDYVARDSCAREKACSRCGQTQAHPHVTHDWEETWQYESLRSCSEVRF